VAHPTRDDGNRAGRQAVDASKRRRISVAVLAGAAVSLMVLSLGITAFALLAASAGRADGAALALRLGALASAVAALGGAVAAVTGLAVVRRKLFQADRRFAVLSTAATTTTHVGVDLERLARDQDAVRRELHELTARIAASDDALTERLRSLDGAVSAYCDEQARFGDHVEDVLDRQMSAAVRSTMHATDRAFTTASRRSQSLTSLYVSLNPAMGFPSMDDWEESPLFSAFVADMVLERRPTHVVTVGGGIMALILALALERNASGTVSVLEHDAASVRSTQRLLDRYGVNRRANVLECPLRPMLLDGREYTWLSLDPLELDPVDLVIVGGHAVDPPIDPAIAVLEPRLCANVRVVVGNAAHADRHAVVDRWCDSLDLESVSVRNLEGLTLVLGRAGGSDGAAPLGRTATSP
jgi:hypothetical protein